MADFKLGRLKFVWKGPWSASTSYVKDDVVRYHGSAYICISAHTSTVIFADDLSRWQAMIYGASLAVEAYDPTATYLEGDSAVYNGSIYVAKGTTTGNTPTDPTHWSFFVGSMSQQQTYAVTTDIIPAVNDSYDLGSITHRWKDLYLSGTTIYLGSSTLSTDLGNLTFESDSGTIELLNDTNITGNLDVTGNINLGGNITIGDQPYNGGSGDTITVVADFGSDLIPKTPGQYNLGANGAEWAEIHVNSAIVGGINLAQGGSVSLGDIDIHDNIIEVTASNTDLILRANGTGNINPQSFIDFGVNNTSLTVTNLIDPTNPQDAATKNYVDSSIQSDIILTLNGDTGAEQINVYLDSLVILGTADEIETSVVVDNNNQVQVVVGLPDNVTVSNNLTVNGTMQVAGGTVLSPGTNIDQITTITCPLTLTQNWQDVGIAGTDLASGTYIIQLFADDGSVNSFDYYSGTMSWFSGVTNTSSELPTDEIVLHRAGAGTEAGLYLRTYKSTLADGGKIKLQMYSNTTTPSSSNYVFKFRRMI